MKKINQIMILFLMLMITTFNKSMSNEWQSIPYPEFKPYTQYAHCKSDLKGNIWLFNGFSSTSPFAAAKFDGEAWTEFSQSAGTLPKDTTIERVITLFNGDIVAITPLSLYFSNKSSTWNKVNFPEIGSNSSPIITIQIEDAIEDRNGNIWVLRNLRFNGINISNISRYNGIEWTTWSVDLPIYNYKGVNVNQFRSYGNYSSIKQAPNGDIWLMGRNGFIVNPDSADKYELGGIARWNGTDWKFWKKQFSASPSLLNDNGSNFTIDDKNRLIIAQGQISNNPFVSGGITMFDNGAFTFYRQDNGTIPSDTALGLPGTKFGNMIYNKDFIALDVAAKGSTWYFNTPYHGILEFDGVRWSAIANKTNGLINVGNDGGYGIAIDKNGDVWATILGGNLVRLRKTTSSVNERATQGFFISPNPAHTSLKLIFENKTENQVISSLNIYNSNGVKMLHILDSENIDISTLPNGTYYLNFNINNNNYFEKFIVKK